MTQILQPPVSVVIAPSTTDGTLVAADPGGGVIKVCGYTLFCGATATSFQFNSKGSGAGTVLLGPDLLPANGGVEAPFTTAGYFQTKPGEGLSANTLTGSNVSGTIQYQLLPGAWGMTPTGPATKFNVVASTKTPVAGVPFTVKVTVLDSGNQVVSGYGGMLHFTSTDTLAVLPADVKMVNGAASFVVKLYTAGSRTVTVTDTVTGSITGVTATLTVGSAAGVVMSFTQQPTTVNHNASISPAVTVTVKDLYGNVVTNSPAYVTLTLSAGGTLTNGGATATSSGVATFSTLQIDNGGSYTLTASSPGIPSVVSSAFTVTALSSLLSNLVAYWSLSDTSDATGGGRTLTNNNAVTFVAGLVGNAASFVAASSMSLSRASDSALQMGGKDFTVAIWFKGTITTAHGLLGKMTGISAGTCEWGVFRYTDGNVYFFLSDGATVNGPGTAVNPSSGAWHLAIARYDTVGHLARLRFDNVDQADVSLSLVVQNLATVVRLGAYGTNFFDGLEDEGGIWSSAPGAGGCLTDAQCTSIWGGGAGIAYPFTGVP